MEMLGAITGLIGAGLSAQSQANQQAIEMQNLMWQKQRAAQQDRMASAQRTDAYGNTQYYDPTTNRWVLTLTPTQKSITNAGEQEQLKSLTTDAQQNRQVRRQQYLRALDAEEPYNTAVQHYKYDQPASEDSIRNDLETLMLQANQDKMKGQQDSLARQAIRLGRGADIPALIKSTDDQLGKDTASAMLQARQGATQERAARVQAHDAQFLPEISKWADIVNNGGGSAAQRFSNTPQELDAMQGQQASQIMQAMQAGSSGVGGAYNALAGAMGKSPDLSGVAKGLTGGGKSSGGGNQAKKPAKYSLTNTNTPWDDGTDWGSTGDYLNNVDWNSAGSGGGNDFLF